MGFQIPPSFCISFLKKIPAENYGFPDPANFLHQIPQKESSGILRGSRSHQLSASASSLKYNPEDNYGAPDPANFLHQLPPIESGRKLEGSRSRQLSASAPSKRIRRKIMGLQIPPTFCISSLKKNPAENYGAPDPANFLHQLPQKESGRKVWVSRSRQLSASASSLKKNPAENYGAPDSKRIQRKIMGLQIPPTFCISSLKKNPAVYYGFTDPANFLHQPAPSKRIRRKIWGSRSR
jgi:hypothetical protein